MIDDGECGTVGGIKIGRETEVFGENPPQVAHDLTWP
jgi:hypothetical protein